MESKPDTKQSPEISEEQRKPLLESDPPKTLTKQPKTRTQKAIRKTFKGSFRLSNLLPSCAVLIFEMVSPILSNRGNCDAIHHRIGTLCLVAIAGISSFLMHFIDGVKDERGKIRYGVATFRGIWIIDGTMELRPEEAEKYRIRAVDFLHGLMSAAVFMAVAMLDRNVTGCFFPTPSEEVKEMMVRVPIGVGVVSSLLFSCFPSRRNAVVAPSSKK